MRLFATMRAFVCVDMTDEAVLAAVGRVQRRLREEGGARPVESTPIHFTLVFLGDVPGEDGAEGGRIATALASVRFGAFSAAITGVGAFPSVRRPRAVWVGTDEEGGRRLSGLAASVRAALGPAGLLAGGGREKKFRAHATISRAGRGAGGKGGGLSEAVRDLGAERFGTQPVRSFKLKRSVLAPAGAVHTEIAEVSAAA